MKKTRKCGRIKRKGVSPKRILRMKEAVEWNKRGKEEEESRRNVPNI